MGYAPVQTPRCRQAPRRWHRSRWQDRPRLSCSRPLPHHQQHPRAIWRDTHSADCRSSSGIGVIASGGFLVRRWWIEAEPGIVQEIRLIRAKKRPVTTASLFSEFNSNKKKRTASYGQKKMLSREIPARDGVPQGSLLMALPEARSPVPPRQTHRQGTGPALPSSRRC